ncbi:hypothetical protein [Pseudoalteromonas tunicata]|jgi:hypothetical protein|uniref:Putative orphan protein n=1 Tax=Pseudoalteromonas tunicata D2 TaxID=87626 RepID=A4C6W2_9GAMM|nr:hypothetical protein [Pseudoalteromonas tunicata]ATC95686.1 hypothetical protein PTUN_a3341 [Pseudoalteromonas tunicata]AXT31247.1 hypothetical protein D1819_10785 [Pseudoalteromonas tunicata]EAR29716.1 putative orphan protein [Pseudoalteromonas tunicata D2]
MSDTCKVIFEALNAPLTVQQAKQLLQTKFKLSDATVAKFLQGDEAFSATTLEKATKQQKLFASVGIQVKLVQPQTLAATSTAPDSGQKERDLKIINALDYITTSLIRLEEKVDELAQNQQAKLPDLNDDLEPEHHAEPLEFEEDLDAPIKKQSNKLFILIGGGILVLLVALLLVSLMYPDLLKI